jgi:phosphatidylserine/phosphatidylglycerophosphate/cardiolipin synthase-like enzyme
MRHCGRLAGCCATLDRPMPFWRRGRARPPSEDLAPLRPSGPPGNDDAHWYSSGTPPRPHNRVTPLVDGQAYFTALHQAFTNARQYIYIAGWCLTPAMPLCRHDRDAVIASRLLEVLGRASSRFPVRILLWDGDAAFFQPTRRQAREVKTALEAAGGDIQCHLDASAPRTHCHHQKAVVVDGSVAFVGGRDITKLAADRWDTTQHPLRVGPTWHDVQLCIEGPAVGDVEANFRQRWQATTGQDDLPRSEPRHVQSWSTPVQIVRTIPKGCYRTVPDGEFGISHAYSSAIRHAEWLIYLENQYLWADAIVDDLAAAVSRRVDALRIVIVLPARAERGKWDNDRQVERLLKLDAGRGIVSVYSPYTWGTTLGTHPFSYRPTYVHAKVGIVDDAWLVAGSANLNERGLARDSEIDALVHDPVVARSLRVALWAEHLGLSSAEIDAADPFNLIDHAWPARSQATKRTVAHADLPLHCPAHPYDLGRMPGARIFEEAEALTFDR